MEQKELQLQIKELADDHVTITWELEEGVEGYRVYWADADTSTMQYQFVTQLSDNEYTLSKSTHVPHFLKVSCMRQGEEAACSKVLRTPVKKVFHEQLEKLNRGLVAIPVKNGIFLSWRLFLDEVQGYSKTGMTGTDFTVYRNGEKLALVTDSTNYLDKNGTKGTPRRAHRLMSGNLIQ